MPERELRDVSENQTSELLAEEVQNFALKKCILFSSGGFLSVFGLVGGLLDITTNILNRYVFHAGKLKWLIHDGLIAIGILGIFIIFLGFPSVRNKLCKCCRMPKIFKRKNRYRSLVNNDVEAATAPEA